MPVDEELIQQMDEAAAQAKMELNEIDKDPILGRLLTIAEK